MPFVNVELIERPHHRRASTARALVATLAALAIAPAAIATATPAASPTPLCCIPDGPVSALVMDGTTAYFGGDFTRVGPPVRNFGVVDAVTGDLRPGGPEVDGTVWAVAADGSGGWYIGGEFTTVGGLARGNLAHVLSDGSVDAGWAPRVNGTVYALLNKAATVYVGGRFTAVDGITRSNLVALDPVTAAVLPFAGGVTGGPAPTVLALLGALSGPTSDLALYVGGSFSATTSGAPRANLAAFTSGGATDAWSPPVNDTVHALARAGTMVYAGGYFSTAGPDPDGAGPGVAPTRQNLAAFGATTGTLSSWDAGSAGIITRSLVIKNGALFAGGSAVLKLSLASGAQLPLPPGQFGDNEVTALSASESTLHIGGSFNAATPGVRRTSLAGLTLDSGALSDWDPNAGPGTAVGLPLGNVRALASQGTAVAVGGSFTTLGGQRRSRLAAVDVATGNLTPFDGGLDKPVRALAVHGKRLYVGGVFTAAAGSTPRQGSAAFDLTSRGLTGFDPDVNGLVHAIGAGAEAVYLSGSFSVVGGLQRYGLAAVDPETGAAGSFNLTEHGTDPDVTSLTMSGSTVFAAGGFLSIAGNPLRHLARLQHVPGTFGVVLGFDAGFSNDGERVSAVAVEGETVYAGGSFDVAGGDASRPYLAAFDAVSGAIRPWRPEVSGDVLAVAASDSSIVTAGYESATSLPYLKAFDPITAIAQPWVPAARGALLASSPEGGLVVVGPGLAAYAMPPTRPTAPSATAGDGSAAVAFAAPPSGGATITSYTVTATPGGASATGLASPLTVAGLPNGMAVTFTVTATNAAGVSLASAPSVPVTPSATRGPSGSALSPLVTQDRGIPVVSRFSVTNRRFAVAGRATAESAARVRRGTSFRFTLSEPAVTRLLIARKLTGRRRGARCVPTSPKLKRRCTRYVAAVTLTRAKTSAGANRVTYTGRVGKRALARGSYRATLVATDAAGNRSLPQTVTFTVVAAR